MRPPLATRQKFPLPRSALTPLSPTPLPLLEDTHANTELRARREKELEETRGLRTNEFPF